MKNLRNNVRRSSSVTVGLVVVMAAALLQGCSAYQQVAGRTGADSSARAALNADRVVSDQHQGMIEEIEAWNASNPSDKAEAAFKPSNFLSTEPQGYFAVNAAKEYSAYGKGKDQANWEAVRTANLSLMTRMFEFTKQRLEGAVNAARQAGSVTEAETAQVNRMRQAALRQAEYIHIYNGWAYSPTNPEPDVNVMRVRTMKLNGFVAPQLASLDGINTTVPAQPLAQQPAESGPTVTRKDIKEMSKDANAARGLAKSLTGG